MFKIYNEAQGDNQSAEILLYDVISDYDNETYGYVSAKTIVNKIKALSNVKNITLRINSAGGDIFQAFAIYNCLKDSKAKITVKVDGIAASSASVIAMAGDKIIMPENSMMMLHNPWGVCAGEADELRAQAEILDKIKDMCIKAYQRQSGLSAEKLSEIMDNETYLSANECKELGLCDKVVDKLDVAAQMKNVLGSINSLTEGEIAKIQEEARIQERERIKALDGLRAPGRQEIIERAKYDNPKDVKDIALELLKADDVQSKLYDRYYDAAAIDKVNPSVNDPGKEAFDNIVNAIAFHVNKMKKIQEGDYNNGR